MRGRKSPVTVRLRSIVPTANVPARLGVFSLFICLLAAAVNFGSAAKSGSGRRAIPASTDVSTNPVKESTAPVEESTAPSALPSVGLPLTALLALQAAPEPGVETYNCTTQAPQTVFNLGDRVCARATGVPAAAFPEFQWRVSWVDPAGLINESDLGQVATTTEYDYTLPTATASTRFDSSPGANDGILVNNRGTWRVNLTRANGAVRATAYFTVRSAANPVADMFVQKFLSKTTGSVAIGSPVEFAVVVGNNGPDAAANVQLADSLPSGASLASITQLSGPACLPADSQTCTIASLGGGDRAEFSVIYIAGGSPGTVETSATVSRATTVTEESDTTNDTSTAKFDVTSGGEATCALVCPNDIITFANTFQGTTHGANVNFGGAEPFGSCGAVTASPSSGSFFPVGTTVVSVTSATGGGACSFNVTVTEDPPPDISCPAPVSAIAEGCEATVSAADLGTPTTTGGTGTVMVTSSRSDGQPLAAPFNVGVTTITYTATDGIDRIDSCTQTVTVTPGNDTANPTITAPPALTLSTGAGGGACGLVITEAELGTPEAADDGCSVSISRTGVPAGNFFPVGTTTVTWKATDGAGKTATATQAVTVVENTPPSIQAPDDATYTCVSEVPAAHPSQANGGDPNLPGGGPVSDNCGTPTVEVTEARSGAGSAASPLIITRTFTAKDASNNTASSVQTITVIDSTPPTIALVGPSSVTHECHTPFNDPGVTTGDNCNAAVNVATSVGFNPDVPGTYVITYTATDGVGNAATAQRTVTVVDTIAPVISCPADIVVTLPLNSTAVSMPVSFSVPASDSCDSTPGVVTSKASGSVFNMGTTVVTATATDDAGNTASCSFSVTVLYNFTGFFSPISNTVLNQANAGRTIPMKFSLSGNKGLSIFVANSPFSRQITCDGGTLNDVQEVEMTGNSSLSYGGDDKYQFNWKTESSWAGTCRELVVKLNDGSEHTARFKFK
jgi:uncharacterized repeat protein (TIGR01451 family)